MELGIRTWQINQNSVSVDYGPLTFSLKIDEEYNELNSAETAIWDSKWQKGADPQKWPSYEINPVSTWNYGLIIDAGNPDGSFTVVHKDWPVDDYPFTADNTPIELKARGRQIPSWGIDQYGLVDVLPRFPVRTTEPVEDITLIPMGAARLRISAFPRIDAD